MAGVKPTVRTEINKNRIYEEIVKFHDLYAHSIPTKFQRISNYYDTEFPCNDVVLIALEEGKEINVNLHLIEMDLVSRDESFNMEYYNNDLQIAKNENECVDAQNDDCEEDWDLIDISTPSKEIIPTSPEDYDSSNGASVEFFDNFSDEDIIALLEYELDGKKQGNEIPAIKAAEEKTVSSTKSEIANHVIVENSDDAVPKEYHQMIYYFKRPWITWQQDSFWILLKIKADENVKYNLEVTNNTVIYK